MNILFVLIPISVILLLLMIGTFVWAVRKGQFEDLDTAAIDILSEDAPPPGRLEDVQPGQARERDAD
ncbi:MULTISPECIES: cbb3-type cytochrome oxidase assembly protein CcoS [unclassified Luteimonas]